MTNERAKVVVRLLRDLAGSGLSAQNYRRALAEAADEMERLREENAEAIASRDEWRALHDDVRATKDAEIARLREALKPFAAAFEAHEAAYPNRRIYGVGEPAWPVVVSALRRAAEVLK